MSTVDSGAWLTIERDPHRPGWLCITVERPRRTRRLWLSQDEAAQLHQLLGRALPAVETRRAG